MTWCRVAHKVREFAMRVWSLARCCGLVTFWDACLPDKGEARAFSDRMDLPLV